MPIGVWLLGLVLASFTLPAFIGPAFIAPALAAEPPRHHGKAMHRSIAVQGVGVVSARPDMAVLNAGVSSQAATAKAALAEHKSVMATLLAALKTFGIKDNNVQSLHVNLHPVYPRQNKSDKIRRPVAFRASGKVRVRLHHVDQLGELLDKMTTAEVNNLSGLHFDVGHPESLEDQARLAALREAKRRAHHYAAEAGVELGPVLRIQEGGGRGAKPEFRAMTMASAGGAIAPGQTEIRMTVSVVYAIK